MPKSPYPFLKLTQHYDPTANSLRNLLTRPPYETTLRDPPLTRPQKFFEPRPINCSIPYPLHREIVTQNILLLGNINHSIFQRQTSRPIMNPNQPAGTTHFLCEIYSGSWSRNGASWCDKMATIFSQPPFCQAVPRRVRQAFCKSLSGKSTLKSRPAHAGRRSSNRS